MDTPTHHLSTTLSSPGSVPNQSHHSPFRHSPHLRRTHHPRTPSNFHKPISKINQQVNISLRHTSSASKYSSPKLLPLISKFEALDADSLTFNIRDAQPPHLRLPGSRMGSCGQVADAQHMKSTRERLLALFDRPGWGARTLRGLRDVSAMQEVDEIPFGKERGPSRSQRCEAVDQSRSPQSVNESERWIPKERPVFRRESRIRDRIKFFDGGMDFPPPGYNRPQESNGATEPVPCRSPTRYQPIVSPTKPGRYSVFPPQNHTGTLTPVKSYGYLRPKDIAPLPWRPLDYRRWETVAHLKNSPETPVVRGRPRERVQRSLITPNHTNAVSAVKKVEITHQDPKRNVSEKVSVLNATGSKERGQEHLECVIQEKGPSSALIQYVQDLSSHKTAKKQGISDESFVETKASWETSGSKSVEMLKPAKESKIKDRINLFSNKGLNVDSFGVSRTRMRNQSTPTKLPSETTNGNPAKASSELRQLSYNTTPRKEKRCTEATVVKAAKIMTSNMLLETAAYPPRVKSQGQELADQAPAPRKSSGICDKIQHFEAFTRGHAARIGGVVVDNNRKWSSSQSKRIQTWPIPASDYVFNCKREQSMVLRKSAGESQIRHEVENNTNSAVSDSTPTKINNIIKSYQESENAKQKMRSRQERLNRRSRSRSRSAPSVSGPANDWDEIPRVFEHMEQSFGVDSKIEKTSKAAEEISPQSKIALTVHLDPTIHQLHLEDGSVKEIWIDGSEDGPPQKVKVVDTVVAHCELAEPRPMRLEETLRIIRLCRGRFGERSGAWRRKMGRSSEKGGGIAA